MDDPILITPRTRDTIVASHREPVVVVSKQREAVAARPITSLWERNGWTRQDGRRGTVYTGEFRATRARSGARQLFAGRIEQLGGHCQAYVRHPPPSLLAEHPKRLCFHALDQGWFHMNWWHGTSCVDETIVYVEKVLAEALNGTWRQG